MSKNFLMCLGAMLNYEWAEAQKDSSHVKSLDEVVVTVTKSESRQSQLGKVITVISKTEIERSGSRNLGELLNEQAGVQVNGALNNLGTNQSIYLRGAGGGRTLILLDGLPIFDPSNGANAFDINTMPVDNIERIEICKGAQSTLYGSDAIAGVINIITGSSGIKKPVNLNASLSLGNKSTFRGNIRLYGSITKKLNYDLQVSRTSTAGYSTALDSTQKSGFDRDGFTRDFIRSGWNWQPIARLGFKIFGQYNLNNTALDDGAFKDAKNYTEKNKSAIAGGGWVYQLGSTRITGNYLYSLYKRDYLREAVYGQLYYKDDYVGRSQFLEVFASTKLGKGFTWLNGTDYRYASMNQQSNYGKFPDTAMAQYSLYSSLFYSSTSGFNLELGARFNKHLRFGTNYTYTFNPSLQLNENFKVYGSLSTGYKVPTLYQLFSAYGNSKLQPEQSVNYEGGLQYQKKSFLSRITYFNRSIQDGLDFNYVTYKYYNFAAQQANGIEWEAGYKFSSSISVNANYTWLHIRENIQSRVSYKDTTYNYALRRPAHTLNLSLNVAPNAKWLFTARMHLESKRYDIGGYNARFNPLPDTSLSSFLMMSAYAEYTFKKRYKFFVDAKNLTDSRFYSINGYNSMPFLITTGFTIQF